MAVIPNIDVLKEDPYNFTTRELRVHAFLTWLLIVLNSILLIMVFINVWTILIRQSKWKSIHFLLFYFMSFIAVTLRLLASIWLETFDNWVINCLFV